MKTYVDIYFDSDSWVLPEFIHPIHSTPIDNSGLRLKIDAFNDRSWGVEGAGWRGYEEGDWISIIDNKRKSHRVRILTSNLFKIIQYNGISNSGRVGGTFSLSRVKGKVLDIYRLIPETSLEFKLKREITDIYRNSNNFTTKMVSGHFYITKTQQLILCLKPGINCYSEDRWNNDLSIVDKPKKLNMVGYITPQILSCIDSKNPKTFEELIFKVFSKNQFFFADMNSSKTLVKDLGELIKPESNSEIDNIILKYFDKNSFPYTIPIRYLLSDELWKNNEIAKEIIRYRISKCNINAYNAGSGTLKLIKDVGYHF